MGSFVSCIQMNADTYEHAPERKMIFSLYFQMLQSVVVEDTVIDTLTGCTFAIYFLVFFGIPWNPGMETEVTVILYVDGTPIVSWRTFFSWGGGRNLCVRISADSGICAHLLWGHCPICTNLTKMLASVTCLFSASQQNNPQNTQERHHQKED